MTASAAGLALALAPQPNARGIAAWTGNGPAWTASRVVWRPPSSLLDRATSPGALRAARATDATPTANAREPSVCVAFVVHSRLSTAALGCLSTELALIWRFNGVEVVYPDDATGRCVCATRAVLLWIVDEPTRLPPGVKVSPWGVGGTIVIDGVPTDLGFILVARVARVPQVPCTTGRSAGRFAAHELGHMLLGSLEHTDRGLMRAGFDEGDMRLPSVPCDAFRLTVAQSRALQRQWSTPSRTAAGSRCRPMAASPSRPASARPTATCS